MVSLAACFYNASNRTQQLYLDLATNNTHMIFCLKPLLLHNLYVVEVDMKNKSVEDIAREAVLQMIGITDALIERQERAEEVQKEEQDG